MISIKKGEVLAHKISPSILALGNNGELGVKVINENSKVLFKEIQVIEDTSEYMLVTGLNEKDRTRQNIAVPATNLSKILTFPRDTILFSSLPRN